MSTRQKRLLNLAIIFLITGITLLFLTGLTEAGDIIIDGNTDDWNGISPLGTDADDMPDDDLDVKGVYVTHDADYLYIRGDVYGNINRDGTDKDGNPFQYIVYLDTDTASIGFTNDWWTTGAEYRIYMDKWNIGLQRFMGGDQADDRWGWDKTLYALKPIDIAYNEGTIEMAVPRIDIGETKTSDSTIVLFRTWPGDDAIPYYNAAPLDYTYHTYYPTFDLVMDNFEYPTDEELNSLYTLETPAGTSLEIFSESDKVNKKVYQGDYSARLTYSLDGLWSMVKLIRHLPLPEDWSKDREISLWVKGYPDSTDNFLVYIIEKDGDEWFYQNTAVLINEAWTKVIIPLSDLEDNLFDGNLGNGRKTLTEVIGYKIAVQDVTDDGSSPTDRSIYIDNLIREVRDDDLPPSPHPIPDINNYTVYYGSGRVKDLSKFDLVIIQPGNYKPHEIAEIKKNGTIVLGYISLGEDAHRGLLRDDKIGPITPQVFPGIDYVTYYLPNYLTMDGYASYYIDALKIIRDDNDKLIVIDDIPDGYPDQNWIWEGYYINAGNAGWQEYVIDDLSKKMIDNGLDGFFFDTIGMVETIVEGRLPYAWTAPGMISLIAAIREAYPDKYLVANGAFSLFDDLKEYINGSMVESFSSTYDFSDGEGINCDSVNYILMENNKRLADRINTLRGYPYQTEIDVLSLDYSWIDDTPIYIEDYVRAEASGFIPSVSDICLSRIYMVNPANDLHATRTGVNKVILSWTAPSEYVTDANLDHYIIKRSTDGPIDTDEEWAGAALVSDNIPSTALSFIDETAPSGQVYYAMQAVKKGGLPLIGRLKSCHSPMLVDGDPSDWDWHGISPLGTDPDDIEEDDLDLKGGYVTNNNSRLFLRTDVYGNINPAIFDTYPNSYVIYLDTDQDKGTGYTAGWWATGADYRIYLDQWNKGLQRFMGTNQTDDKWGWGGNLYALESTNTTWAFSEGILEFGVLLSDIRETAPQIGLNILWRIWPGDDSIPYYDSVLTYAGGEGVGNGCEPTPGDLDGDDDVDRDDLNIILAARNTPADVPDDPRDLDDDGMITGLDSRILVTLCTRPRCVVE